MRPLPAEQLAQALFHILQMNGINRSPISVRVSFQYGPCFELPLEVTANGQAAENNGSAELHDLILDALADSETPLKTSAIARRVNRKYDGHFRRVIKGLREAGEIVLAADGATYSLPE